MPPIFEDIYAYVHPQDANCNVFVFKDGQDLDFIDTGVTLFGINFWLWKQLRKDGLEPTNIRNIFHCHIHPDHYQADLFFQQKAIKYRGKVNVYYPRKDGWRLQPNYRVLLSNFMELEKTLGTNPIAKKPITPIFAKLLAEPILKSNIPHNLIPYDHNQLLTIGNRKAKVIHTGGHTEGHSYLYFQKENILVNSDSGCINEFGSDFEKVLNAISIVEDMHPENLLGGHNAIHLGMNRSLGDIQAWGRRLSDVTRPLLIQMIPGKMINVTQVGWRRVGVLHRMGLVETWAEMTPYVCAKYLQKKGFGALLANDENIYFKVTEEESKKEDIAYLRSIAKLIKEPFHRKMLERIKKKYF
jgi:glyoxylase-like metal-dependent hydrolase (beta-lactamase superfamily II)